MWIYIPRSPTWLTRPKWPAPSLRASRFPARPVSQTVNSRKIFGGKGKRNLEKRGIGASRSKCDNFTQFTDIERKKKTVGLKLGNYGRNSISNPKRRQKVLKKYRFYGHAQHCHNSRVPKLAFSPKNCAEPRETLACHRPSW